jgi:hypothetical protein
MIEAVADSGETLASLAQKYLGDYQLWESIADFNDLTPFQSIAGLTVIIPDIVETLQSTVNISGFETLNIQSVNGWNSLQWV